MMAMLTSSLFSMSPHCGSSAVVSGDDDNDDDDDEFVVHSMGVVY